MHRIAARLLHRPRITFQSGPAQRVLEGLLRVFWGSVGSRVPWRLGLLRWLMVVGRGPGGWGRLYLCRTSKRGELPHFHVAQSWLRCTIAYRRYAFETISLPWYGNVPYELAWATSSLAWNRPGVGLDPFQLGLLVLTLHDTNTTALPGFCLAKGCVVPISYIFHPHSLLHIVRIAHLSSFSNLHFSIDLQ